MYIIIPIVFFLIGVILMIYNKLISEFFNTFSNNSVKDIKNIIGKKSIVRIRKKHVKYIGMVFIFESIFFLYYLK